MADFGNAGLKNITRIAVVRRAIGLPWWSATVVWHGQGFLCKLFAEAVMVTEPITLANEVDAARAFRSASADEQEKLQTLMSVLLERIRES